MNLLFDSFLPSEGCLESFCWRTGEFFKAFGISTFFYYFYAGFVMVGVKAKVTGYLFANLRSRGL